MTEDSVIEVEVGMLLVMLAMIEYLRLCGWEIL